MRVLQLAAFLAATVGALPQPQVGSGIPPEALAPRQKRAFRIRNDNLRQRANAVIPVIVGGAQDYYIPNMVQAAVGDIVQFQFSNGNHTVTQSEEATPCQPLEGGVNSGHIPYTENSTTVGTFNLPVMSTDPMFIYCATGPHCTEGQVMVINPVSEEQVVNYAKTAQSMAQSVDNDVILGGTIGTIPLDQAAFIPAAEEEAGPPPDAADPDAGDAADGLFTTLTGTVTQTVTVPPAAATA